MPPALTTSYRLEGSATGSSSRSQPTNDVVSSFRRGVIASSKPTTWGVTLPASTSAQLTRLMAVNDGGELIIDAGGQLRLQR